MMQTSAAKMPSEPGGVVLNVIAGQQRGGSLCLVPGRAYTIGNGPCADVLLRDRVLRARHAVLHVQGTGGRLQLEVLGEAVIVDDRAHASGDRVVLSIPCRVRVGQTVFELARSTGEAASTCPATPGGVGRPLLCLVLGVCALTALLGLIAETRNGDVRTATPLPDVLSRADLAAPEFAGLEIDETTDPPLIHGFVKTRAARIQLEQALLQSGLAYNLDIRVGEHTVDRVVDTFRVNGIDVELVDHDASRLVLRTGEISDAELDRVRDIVTRDVPQLPQLLVHSQPRNAQKPSHEAVSIPVSGDKDKRVALVVSAAPAHVVTADQSRYFIGSLLPSGHRISTIEAGRVSLVKDGVTTEMQF